MLRDDNDNDDDQLTLRQPEPGDAPTLLRWRSDPENGRLLMWRTSARTSGDVDAWIARRTGDPQGSFAIVARREQPIGFVQLTRIDRVDGHAYLGLLIDPDRRCQGAASRALLLMEERARVMGLRKLMLEVLGHNAQALRFWSKRGYCLVGSLRRHHEHDGKHHDVVLLEKMLWQSESGAAVEAPARAPLPMANQADLIRRMASDPEVRDLTTRLLALMGQYKYAYNWAWYGRPIIQLPQDVMAMQMLILDQKPDLIIETGIAHGGSLVFCASMLELLGEGQVLGVDIDIRAHNRVEIEAHPLAHRIAMLEGSSIDPAVAQAVHTRARAARKIMVCLDSNHTADHVARELALYAPLVTPGQHLVVFDTAIEDLPASSFPDRPWGPGNSPKTAVRAFLEQSPWFQIDRELEARLLFTVAPDGYLKRIAWPPT